MVITAFLLTSCGRDKKSETPDQADGSALTSGEALYDFYDNIMKQLDPMASAVTDAYNTEKGKDFSVSFPPFNNNCIDVYSFSEGMADDFVKDVLDSFYEDLRLEESGKNEYTLYYTGTDLYTDEKFKGKEVITFDPAKLRMSCVLYRNGI